MKSLVALLTIGLSVDLISCGPLFFRGRPLSKHGMLGTPAIHPELFSSLQLPEEQWFDQKLNHFDPVDTRTWKQVL